MRNKNYSVARVEQRTRVSIGKYERHIERKNDSYENMNVNLRRTPMNVHFKGCGDLTYNAVLDKLVEDGTVSLRGLKQDAKVFDEMIFDVNSAYFEEHGGYEYAVRFYREAFRLAEKEYGPGNVISAVMHADELNAALTEQLGRPVYHYHMHIVALPVVEKEIRWSKRCKDPALVGTVKEVIHQVSHSKKWASQKVADADGNTQIVKSYSLLQDRFFEHMTRAGFRDFERGERGSTVEHLSVLEYKTKQELERLVNLEMKEMGMLEEISVLEEKKDKASEQADAAMNRINELAPKLENVEDFAREYSDDADKVLPDVGALESARSYREKKARPLFESLIKALRSLYHSYLDLKERFDSLWRDYSSLRERYHSLDRSYDRLSEEYERAKSVEDDYKTLCRGYGAYEVYKQVRAIKEQEAEERMPQRTKRHRDEYGAR